jgi:hypothetical protein
MKRLRHAMFLIAAYALFNWAIAQNTDKIPLAEQCIPQNSFTALSPALVGQQTDTYGHTSVALGSYERISPDGRFVLRSFSGARLGEVSLIELDAAGQAVAAYATPLTNEAFPVQGSWRYLVDVNGDHYTFSSLLGNNSKDKQQIKPVFRGGMTGFYAAAAELPFDPARDQAGQVRIRSMSWPNASGDGDAQGKGALVARTLEVDTARQQITSDSGNVYLCGQRWREDGTLYALPMLSVDGLEFAALPQTPVHGEPTMRIFSFGDAPGKPGSGCEPQAAFGFSSGKTIFGFPQTRLDGKTSPADLAYEYQGHVWWYHRGQGMGEGQRFNVAPYYDEKLRTYLTAGAFPGITRDGRVIYGATEHACAAPTPGQPPKPCIERAGYVTSDPYQSNAYQQFLQQHKGPARRQCITHGDVARERAAFSTLHGLEISTLGVK